MSIYRFDEQSLIDEVTFYRTPGGGMRAYLHARDNVTSSQLESIKNSLTTLGLQWAPTQHDAKPTLEVRGFERDEDNLLAILQKNGGISGKHLKEVMVTDNPSFIQRLKKNTLNLSGLLYLVGDAGFVFYGWREAFTKNAVGKRELTNLPALLAGIFYALGTPFILKFGHGDKSDIQLKHMSYNLIDDLEKQGITVPQDAAVRAAANGHNTNPWKRLHTFCERYPAEITNSFFGVAGSMIMWEKIRQVKTFDWGKIKQGTSGRISETIKFLNERHKIPGQTAHSPRSVIMDIGLGLMTVTAGLISVLIEEEVPKPEEKKEKGFMGLLQKIKQRPLAAASGFLMVATVCHGVSTHVDWKDLKADLAPDNIHKLTPKQLSDAKELKTSLPGRALFVVTNLLAEIVMAVSSKGHGSGVKSDHSLEHSAYAVGADLVQRAAPGNREALLNKVTQFYANKKHLGGSAEAIEKGIRAQLSNIIDNPWAGVLPVRPSTQDPEQTRQENYWRGREMTPKAEPSLVHAI